MADFRITIRKACLEDNELLAEMGARTFTESFGQYNSPEDMAEYLASSFSSEKQAGELSHPGTTYLIAEASKPGTSEIIPVGFARLKIGGADFEIAGSNPIELVRIYAEKSWMGRGVGSALMRVCLDLASEKGCDLVWLGVWQKNQRAISFYQKWGFSIVGTQPFLLGSDLQQDYVMARKARQDEID